MRFRLVRILNEIADSLPQADQPKNAWTDDVLRRKARRLAHEIRLVSPDGPVWQVIYNVMVNADDWQLKKSHLLAIDKFLSVRGEGLDRHPILEEPGILRSLIQIGNVVYIVKARIVPNEHRSYLSPFDVQARENIDKSLNGSRRNVRTVLHQQEADRPDEWSKLLSNRTCSHCMIGSPLALPFSERALAHMFSVEAFQPPDVVKSVAVPFRFVWHPKEKNSPVRIKSALAIHPDELARLKLQLPNKNLPARILAREAQAFILHDRHVWEVNFCQDEWNEYGVIVAQRQPSGQILLVVAGLSGPSTLGAAKMIDADEMREGLPEPIDGKPGGALYAVVEVPVKRRERDRQGENRALDTVRFLQKPTIWNPPKP